VAAETGTGRLGGPGVATDGGDGTETVTAGCLDEDEADGVGGAETVKSWTTSRESGSGGNSSTSQTISSFLETITILRVREKSII
jgi:hypothetical protein